MRCAAVDDPRPGVLSSCWKSGDSGTIFAAAARGRSTSPVLEQRGRQLVQDVVVGLVPAVPRTTRRSRAPSWAPGALRIAFTRRVVRIALKVAVSRTARNAFQRASMSFQLLDLLARVAVDRHAGGAWAAPRPSPGVFGARQSVSGTDSELTTNTTMRFTWSRASSDSGLVQCLVEGQHVEHAGQAQVVRDPPSTRCRYGSLPSPNDFSSSRRLSTRLPAAADRHCPGTGRSGRRLEAAGTP